MIAMSNDEEETASPKMIAMSDDEEEKASPKMIAMSGDEEETASRMSDCASVEEESSEYTDSDSEEVKSSHMPDNEEKSYSHIECIRMQRLAKKKRLFLIQKLSRRIKQLKTKKGNEAQLSKNLRKSDRVAQKFEQLKILDLKETVSVLIERKFITEPDDADTSKWFQHELTCDKNSFMSYVNSLGKEVSSLSNTDSIHSKKLTIKKVSSKHNEKPNSIKFKSERKNRPGQRARQKIWEELHGTEAKHLHKQKVPEKPPRQGKNISTTTATTTKSKDCRSVQEILSDLKKNETKDNVENKAPKSEHPSWIAKKQQSAQSSKIDVFAGTKITFDDSD